MGSDPNSSITSIDGLTGWRHLALVDVGSTNAEALKLASEGDAGHLWITAEKQLAGRARRGRSWVSERGNLYASLLHHSQNEDTVVLLCRTNAPLIKERRRHLFWRLSWINLVDQNHLNLRPRLVFSSLNAP